MRVVDSSAWIEWMIESATGNALLEHFPEQSESIVPTIVQSELSKWLAREKGEDDADRFIAYTMKCVVVPLDTTLALRAAECAAQFKLAMADAIVYATAIHNDASLLTCDEHFNGLPSVVLISKSASR